jgi:archaellum component FlaC
MPGLEQALGESEAERTAATEDVARLASMVQEQQRRTDALATVVEKAELVRDRLQQDKSLAEAVEQLKQSHQGEAEQLAALQQMMEIARERVTTREGQLGEAQVQLENSRKELAGLQQQIPQLEQQLPQLEGELQQKQEKERVELEKTTSLWSQQFAVSSLKALQPEEFAWALMQSVGLVEQTRSSLTVELDKNSPMSDEDKADSVKVEARRRQLEEQVHEKLKGNVGQFVTLFGAAAGQPQDDFFSTVDQALFIANGGPIRGWLNPSGNNLAARLQNEQDITVLAEELYLSVLTRRPSETEANDVEDYLSSRAEERTQAVQEMIWALLASAEFRFNH